MPEFNNRLMFDVGVDVWAYRPVPMAAIRAKMASKLPSCECSDGERAAGTSGGYAWDPQDRMVETRMKNLEFLRAAGVSIGEEEENIYGRGILK